MRLVFTNPLSPLYFSRLLECFPKVRSSMLGNTLSRDKWIAAHKATLFFDEPSEERERDEFELTFQRLTRMCTDALHEQPRVVSMTAADRSRECAVCGSQQKGHTCISHVGSVKNHRESYAQQLQKQSAPPKATAAAAQSAPAAAAKTPMLLPMCGHWRKDKLCDRRGCKGPHPDNWVVPDDDWCRDLYNRGVCKYGVSKCKYKHVTLEEAQILKAKQAAALAGVNIAS